MPRSFRCPTRVANVADGDRVDAGERLVEQDEMGLGGERAGDLAAPALAARERHRRGAAQMGDRKLGQQRRQHLLAQIRRRLHNLEDRADVLLDREAAKDRRFLRQIADAEAGAPVHRQIGDVTPVEHDHAGIGRDQPGDDVKARRLAGPVRAEQADRFAALDRKIDPSQNRPPLKALAQPLPHQTAAFRRGIVGNEPRLLRQPRRRARGQSSCLHRLHGFFPPTAEGFAALPALPDEVGCSRTKIPSTRGAGAPGLAASVIIRLTFRFRSTTAYWPLIAFCPRVITTLPSKVTMPVSAS